MRVLQVISTTERRGAQVFALDLHDELRRRGNDVTTVALCPGTSSELLPVEVLGPKRWSIAGQLALRRLAKASDVVIAHGAKTAVACTFSIGRTRTPVVYRQISDSQMWANTPVRRLRVRAYLSQMSQVVALWSGSAKVLTEYLGVPADKITVIPNGVRPDAFEAVAAARQVPSGRPRIGYLGALVEEKGIDDLRWLAEQLPEVDVVLAGDGPLRASLAALAPRNLMVLGPTDDPAAFLAGIDYFVFPSWTESMPAVLIEAAFTGLPMVVTDVGAAREMVGDGTTGFVVPPRDRNAILKRVRELIGDESLREKLSSAAPDQAKQFSIEVVGSQYHQLLRRYLRA